MADALKIQVRVDRMLLAFSLRGLMPRVVRLAVATMAGADAASGTPGTATTVYTALPRAMCDLRDQVSNRGGQTTHIGDAKIVCATDVVTRAALLAASWLDIDGEKFTVVIGELRCEAFITAIVVKRMQA